MRVRVFIATTEGPVAVQRITAEDPDVPSVACRDGTTEVLAISRDYTRFVDRGTGLVAALTGHGAYRLDLDRPVDGGRSWQLPVLLAHLLEAEGRLAGPDEPADLALLATGEVDRNQRVRPVGRIGEKLAAAGDLIARHAEMEPPLSVLLPAADRTPDLEARLPDGGASAVRILAWERIKSLAALEEEHAERPSQGRQAPSDTSDAGGNSGTGETAATGDTSGTVEGPGADEPPAPRSKAGPGASRGGGSAPEDLPGRSTTATPAPARTESTRRRQPRATRKTGLLLLLAAAVVGLGAGAAWWDGPRHWETLRHAGDYAALERALREAFVPPLAERYRSELQSGAPSPEHLVFGLVEQRTADARPCFGRTFRDDDREDLAETPLAARKPGFFRSERGSSLCRIVYRVANEGEQLVYLYFAVRPAHSVAAGETGVAPVRRAAALPSGASLTLDLDLAQYPDRILGADLLILAAPSPSPQIRQAFELATNAGGEPGEEASGSLHLTALPALGLTVKGASHAILR